MATAAAKPAVPAAAAAAPAADAPKKSKFLLVVLLVVVLVSVGAGAAWWFLMHNANEDEEAEAPWKPSIFLPIDQFTVNLQAEEGQQQFLQMAMTLSVADQEVAETIKAQMPQVRSRVLFLLSSKKPSDLASLEGKNLLTQQLIREVDAVLPPAKSQSKKHKKADDDDGKKKGKNKKTKAPESAAEEEVPHRVLAVYFTHFIVQ